MDAQCAESRTVDCVPCFAVRVRRWWWRFVWNDHPVRYDSDTNTDACAHTNANPDADTNANPDADTHANAHANAYAYANRNQRFCDRPYTGHRDGMYC